MGYSVSGNKTLFYSFKVLNIILLLAGLLLIGLGIWLWIGTQKYNFFAIVLLGLGTFNLFLSLIAWKVKKSKYRLKFYCFFLLISFICQIFSTIFAIIYKEKIVDAAKYLPESQDEINKLKDLIRQNVTLISFLTLGVIGVQLFCLIFSFAYQQSLSDTNATESGSYKKLYDDGQGNKVSLQEKQDLNERKSREKYDNRKYDLEQKYGVKFQKTTQDPKE